MAHRLCGRQAQRHSDNQSRAVAGTVVVRRGKRRTWIGSMILVELLHASAKRVVLEYSSMVRRSACCAPAVMLVVWRGVMRAWWRC